MAIDHFSDRLMNACRQKGPICVGVDPVLARLPRELLADLPADPMADGARPVVETIRRFVRGVFEAVAPFAPCVKLQSACFERYLWPGVEAYHQLTHEAAAMGLLVIGDAKRGDIGISAEHYAAGCLSDVAFKDLGVCRGPDALTVNAYLGSDSLTPFIDAAKTQGKGLFALVRTSNPGGDAIQGLQLADGRTVGEAVAQHIAALGEAPGLVGMSGYSLLGAVVGATKPRDAVRLRELMPRQIFLVPGFGAQGGTADDVRPCFRADGTGAIITASRSVLFAYEKSPAGDWRKAIADAARDMQQQVRAIVGN